MINFNRKKIQQEPIKVNVKRSECLPLLDNNLMTYSKSNISSEFKISERCKELQRELYNCYIGIIK